MFLSTISFIKKEFFHSTLITYYPHSILLFPIAFEIVSVARGTYQRLTTNLLYTRIPHHFHSALLSTTWHRLPKNHSFHRLTTRLYKTAFLSNRRNFFTQEHGKLSLTQRKDFTSVGVKRISRITVSNRDASPFSTGKKRQGHAESDCLAKCQPLRQRL